VEGSEALVNKHLVTFDGKHKLAYVYAPGCDHLTNRGRVARTKDAELKRTTLYLDLDETGRVIGVEILAPSRVTLTEIMEQFSKKFKPKAKKKKRFRKPPKPEPETLGSNENG
jgi:uncharacterized protein YuzE